jgi:PAS domain S-box-containing protein
MMNLEQPDGDINEPGKAMAQGKSGDKYRVLFDSMVQGAFFQRADGSLVDCNPALLKMLGMTREQFIGRTTKDSHWKVIREDGSELPWKEYPSQRAMASGEPVTGVLAGIFNPVEGDYRWVVISATPMFEPGGSVVCQVLVTLHDVTELRQAKTAFQVSEEKYRALFEHAPLAYQSLDATGCLIDVNPGWLEMLGYERDDVIGKNFADFLHPDTRSTFAKNFPAFKARGLVHNVQFRLRHKFGRYIDIELNGCIGYYPDGSFRQTYCVFQDVTLRKLAEEKLRKSEETYRGLLNHLSFGVVVHAPDTSILLANPAVCKLLGLSSDQIIGKVVADSQWNLLCEDGTALPLEDYPVNRVLASGEPVYNQVIGVTHALDGSLIWILVNGFLVTDVSGGCEQIIITFVDITEQKKMQERLRQSEKMDAIGQLAGGVAHDFNNQLSGILGYADLLLNRLEDPTLRRYAENIISASRHAAELTSQLLAFGRKGKNLNAPVDIHQVIGEAVSILERSIDKRIRIVQNLCPRPVVINGDPTQIYNALLNLGINARDAMPEGGELTYATERIQLDSAFIQKNQYDLETGDYVCISVTDTGIGMSKETQQKVFEPFFTTKKAGQGTGLGLSSVYGTVHNHGGAIRVYSEMGQGTTFKIYLAMFEAELSSDGQTPEAAGSGVGRILMVDDEPVLREVGADMLCSLGYQVETCRDGQEAVDYYTEHWRQIDLVILDMVMPRLDGRGAFAAMRKINPNIRAILSSGYSINEKAQSILDDGVMAFVGKPFSRRQLAEVVERVLRGAL